MVKALLLFLAPVAAWNSYMSMQPRDAMARAMYRGDGYGYAGGLYNRMG